MKLFIAFLVGTFMVGVLIRKDQKYRNVIIAGIIVFVCVGYYWLKQV